MMTTFPIVDDPSYCKPPLEGNKSEEWVRLRNCTRITNTRNLYKIGGLAALINNIENGVLTRNK